MELQEFIKNTLVQITNGVVDAQNELKDTGCLINPNYNTVNQYMLKDGRAIQKIKMNVVLEVNESEGTTKGIGVAKVLNTGINKEETTSNSQLTSVEFEVLIAFPGMKLNK
jgi:hypothetical protein